jgi:RecT family
MSNELSTISNVKDLVFNPSAMDQMMRLAEVMSKSVCTVPNHLQKNVGDCFAIVMQSAQWGMNPFVVAQKTHIVNGKLGYEAQLVHALINTMSPIKGHLKFEWRGDWEKYINNGLQKSDEKGLCVVVSGVLQGDDKPTDNITYLAPQTVRNSPLWKTDPKMQLAYLGIKRWSGLHTPSVTLGVYTVDELQDGGVVEKIINPMPDDKPPVDIDAILKSITTMSIEDFKTIDKDSLTPEQQGRVSAAFKARKAAIKEASVVADIKPETAQTSDTTDWGNLIANADSMDALTAIYRSMSPEQQEQHNVDVDFRSSELQGG